MKKKTNLSDLEETFIDSVVEMSEARNKLTKEFWAKKGVKVKDSDGYSLSEKLKKAIALATAQRLKERSSEDLKATEEINKKKLEEFYDNEETYTS